MKKRKWLRIVVFGLVALATLAALGIAVVSYQARQEWAQTKADLLARGEKLSLAELLPPEIPDEENFFGDPIWKEIEADQNDFTIKEPMRFAALEEPLSAEEIRQISLQIADIKLEEGVTLIKAAQRICRSKSLAARDNAVFGIALLEPLRPLSNEIVELLKRPSSRLLVDHEKGFGASTRSLNVILSLARYFSSRAQFEITLGQSEKAASDVVTILKLSRTLDDEPLLIYRLVGLSAASLAYAAIEKGIASHLWSKDQLIEFESLIAPQTGLQSIASALRGERATVNSTIEEIQKNRPGTSLYDNMEPSEASRVPREFLKLFGPSDQALYNRAIQSCVDTVESVNAREPSPSAVRRALGEPSLVSKYFRPIARQGLDALQDSVVRMTHYCERARLLTVACALERYRIETGAYPAVLDTLVPHYLEQLPKAVFKGQTIRYRESGGKFMLWTPGWNEADDMGEQPPKDFRSGDWLCEPNWNNG